MTDRRFIAKTLNFRGHRLEGIVKEMYDNKWRLVSMVTDPIFEGYIYAVFEKEY